MYGVPTYLLGVCTGNKFLVPFRTVLKYRISHPPNRFVAGQHSQSKKNAPPLTDLPSGLDRFAKRLGLGLGLEPPSQIFPWEFWDETSGIDRALKNTQGQNFRFQKNPKLFT